MQLLISKRLGFLPDEASALLLTRTEELLRQLTALCTAIERSSLRSGSYSAKLHHFPLPIAHCPLPRGP